MAENPKWLDNRIQFPRLLAELRGFVTYELIAEVAESMDLSKDEVEELFDRADAEYEQIKALLNSPPRRRKAGKGTRPQQILTVLLESGPLTATELGEKLQQPRVNVSATLGRMAKAGQVEYALEPREGGRPRRRWVPTLKGQADRRGGKQEAIVSAVRQYPDSTTREIAERLRCNPNRIGIVLLHLERAQRVVADRTGQRRPVERHGKPLVTWREMSQ